MLASHLVAGFLSFGLCCAANAQDAAAPPKLDIDGITPGRMNVVQFLDLMASRGEHACDYRPNDGDKEEPEIVVTCGATQGYATVCVGKWLPANVPDRSDPPLLAAVEVRFSTTASFGEVEASISQQFGVERHFGSEMTFWQLNHTRYAMFLYEDRDLQPPYALNQHFRLILEDMETQSRNYTACQDRKAVVQN